MTPKHHNWRGVHIARRVSSVSGVPDRAGMPAGTKRADTGDQSASALRRSQPRMPIFRGWPGTPFMRAWNARRFPAFVLLKRAWERLMAQRDDGDRSLRDILLFVSGLGAGGFLTAILFAMAVSGGLVRFT